jgi:hypothetical protein
LGLKKPQASNHLRKALRMDHGLTIFCARSRTLTKAHTVTPSPFHGTLQSWNLRMEDKAVPNSRIGDSKLSISTSSQLSMATPPKGIVQPREPQANPNSLPFINQYQSHPNAYLSLHTIDKTQVLQPSAVINQAARRDKGTVELDAKWD